MAAPLDESVRAQIIGMFKNKASTKKIVEVTNVSKSQINSMRKKWKNGQLSEKTQSENDQTENSRTGAHARNERTDENGNQTDQTDQTEIKVGHYDISPNEHEVVRHAKSLRNDLFDEYRNADSINDPHDRAWIKTTLAKSISQIDFKIGQWDGLDKGVEDNPIVSPLDIYAEKMAQFTEDR